MGLWQSLLALVLVFTCGLLIIVILLQRGRGGGLVGAFGGAGGTSAFGAKTGDVFTWITVIVASVFVLLSIGANFVFDQSPRPPALPAEISPAPAGGTQVPGLPIKVEQIDGDPSAPPIKIDVQEGPPGTVPPPAQPKPAETQKQDEAQPPSGETAEPKKPEEAPRPGEDKPSP